VACGSKAAGNRFYLHCNIFRLRRHRDAGRRKRTWTTPTRGARWHLIGDLQHSGLIYCCTDSKSAPRASRPRMPQSSCDSPKGVAQAGTPRRDSGVAVVRQSRQADVRAIRQPAVRRHVNRVRRSTLVGADGIEPPTAGV
jgi:hypothetical protein